ncbi:AAA domain-containing protein [Paenibacillaceae bacterium GAS479]|nr:AAA domain-containing protein [Paenibacillaceae bacterium GAS479]
MSQLQFVLEYSRVINFAMQQNHVPIISKLWITNMDSNELRNVQVRIRTQPEFANEWTTTLDVLLPDNSTDLGTVSLQLSSAFLAQLTERLSGSLELIVQHNETVLLQGNMPIDVLAFDEWSGLTELPEMMAAFVTPNHPEVLRVLKEAAEILTGWSQSSAFDAYQSQDPNRVRLQAAAIYAALQRETLTYCVAPASFEQIGQRVRLADNLFAHRMGNCLDLTLLYTACLEAIGLHPLIIFTEGHAFAGVWLVKETFADSVQDDISLITKRMASGIHEIGLVESTALTAGRNVPFEEAERLAATHLSDANQFECFIDIKRARGSAIRPLPLRVVTPSGWEIKHPNPAVDTKSLEAPEQIEVMKRPMDVGSITLPKQKEWERKLLDLTLRNGLLNFRLSRSSVGILNPELGRIEDSLANGEEFQLLAMPKDWKGNQRDANLFRIIDNNDPLKELLNHELTNKRLRSDSTEADLNNRLIHLYRSAKLSLEENGANTLYMALGLLQWYETASSQKARYAPLVLIPVELIRKSSKSGIVLRARDEEAQFNITLLEMLKQDFGVDISGLDPLPKDEQGVDLKRVFTMIRHAVMTLSRWDVVETGYLGLFSFSQFVMWNDIRMRSADLTKNPVVASLMAGRLQWVPEDVFPESHFLDSQYDVDHGAVPISADSSQLAAIYASGEGKSFVLHGPPGTGKSQTITNIIANALATGKKVLFVAEKMAALNVVQSRLAAIGLGRYCLELHSNKSKKSAVLDQLRLALEAIDDRSPEEWERIAVKLAESRRQLNEYVSAMHRKSENGLSVYDAISRYSRVRSVPDLVAFEPEIVGVLSLEQFFEWEELAKELHVAAEQSGHPAGHPWSETTLSDYSPGSKAQITKLLSDYINKLDNCEQKYKAAAEAISFPIETLTQSELGLFSEICDLIASVSHVAPGLLGSKELESDVAFIRSSVKHGRRREELKTKIEAIFSESIFMLDAEEMLSLWKKSELQWFMPKWLQQNRIQKLLRGRLLAGKTLAKAEIVSWLQELIQYKEEEEKLKGMESVVRPLLGEELWNGSRADWRAVEEACDWVVGLHRLLAATSSFGNNPSSFRQGLQQLISEGRHSFVQQRGPMLSGFADSAKRLQQAENEILTLLAVNRAEFEARRRNEAWIPGMRAQADHWLQNMELLRDWCAWRRVREKSAQAGLLPLLEPLEKGTLSLELVVSAFERALYRACAEYLISENTHLKAFSSRLFEDSIRQFQAYTDQFEQITRDEITARLAAKVPHAAQEAAQNSELGILQRAIRSNGRGISIRKLFEQIPNLLQRLCPCILMSPISVAQYLDPSNPQYDLVIFDEASQMPTCEAVGAMARGRHVIVVGDPKQLPPTSFFSSGQSEMGEDELLQEDLESVLDDCLALGMPQGHLLWHYRSRHESLIAFSNTQYYDNKLLTFPSPNERVSSVTLESIEGVYDRGKSKQNRAEAEAVIQEITRRLQDPGLRRLSIGVVTFSSVQQNLIEDMLDETFAGNPELEMWSQEMKEPIFVKNLENVQGDERDVILFSIGYGPDASGKVSMNFGPLNRDGGWRRLNVAVSRARHTMKVFSTLKPEHLNTSRTSSQGVAELKAFLEYAAKGKEALGFRNSVSTSHSRVQGLEVQIADELRRAGHQVDVQIGVSGYRIDLAVIDPQDSSRYALGIVCDGYGYSQAKTARDREILRYRVSEQLGWKLHRVWALDWWENPERELQKIEQALEKALQKEKESEREETPFIVQTAQVPVAARFEGNAVSALTTTTTVKPNVMEEYRLYTVPLTGLSSEEFYFTNHTLTLCKQITDTIEHEGPISRQQLYKRVLQAWGISRTGSRIERRFDEVFAKLQLTKTEHDQVVFFWPKSQNPQTYAAFRISSQESERRNAEDLPPEEISNAVKHVLSSQISLPREDLIKETAKLLGYQRSGSTLDKVVRNGVEIAINRGYAVVDEKDRIVLV